MAKTEIDYGHYHVEIVTEEGLMELTVAQQSRKHIVEDHWGEVTGNPGEILGGFDNVKDAVKLAVMILKKQFNKKIIRGAGCPPNYLLEEVEKELKVELGVE